MSYPPGSLTSIPPIPMPPKYTSETPVVTVDFTPLLDGTDSVSSVSSVTVTVLQGADTNPQNLISGSSQVLGNQVMQKIAGGIAGTQYQIAFVIASAQGVTRTVHVSLFVVSG